MIGFELWTYFVAYMRESDAMNNTRFGNYNAERIGRNRKQICRKKMQNEKLSQQNEKTSQLFEVGRMERLPARLSNEIIAEEFRNGKKRLLGSNN